MQTATIPGAVLLREHSSGAKELHARILRYVVHQQSLWVLIFVSRSVYSEGVVRVRFLPAKNECIAFAHPRAIRASPEAEMTSNSALRLHIACSDGDDTKGDVNPGKA